MWANCIRCYTVFSKIDNILAKSSYIIVPDLGKNQIYSLFFGDAATDIQFSTQSISFKSTWSHTPTFYTSPVLHFTIYFSAAIRNAGHKLLLKFPTLSRWQFWNPKWLPLFKEADHNLLIFEDIGMVLMTNPIFLMVISPPSIKSGQVEFQGDCHFSSKSLWKSPKIFVTSMSICLVLKSITHQWIISCANCGGHAEFQDGGHLMSL